MHILRAGYAKSKDQEPLDDTDVFLTDVISALGLDRPVLVSPSLSGSYTLPFLLGWQPEKAHDKVRGYIPVAPIFTDKFTEEVYKKCQVNLLVNKTVSVIVSLNYSKVFYLKKKHTFSCTGTLIAKDSNLVSFVSILNLWKL